VNGVPSVIEAIGLLDTVLGVPSPEQAARDKQQLLWNSLRSLGIRPVTMGGVATKGCGLCGGTMWRTKDPDGSKQWVCASCGAVE
jgi:hypothetical protein